MYEIALTLLVSASAGIAFGSAFAGTPDIRFTADAPFRDGKCVGAVWEKADRLVRFTTVGTCDLASYPSEARLLFDDRNLYITCKAFHDASLGPTLAGAKIGERDNFELFVRPDLKNGAFVHVIADDLGRKMFLRKQARCEEPAVLVSAETEKDGWRSNVTIPWKVLGVAAPMGEAECGVGIMRLNRRLPATVKLWSTPSCEENSWNPRRQGAYAVPDTWAKMRLTRAAGEARDVVADADGKRVNLLRNSEFDAGTVGWAVSKGVERRETLAMSGEWVLRVAGPLYPFLQGTPAGFAPDREYTLVVRARAFGGGTCAFSADELVIKNGKGACVANAAPMTTCGPDFHDYHFTFRTAPKEQPRSLIFYKYGDKGMDTGLDIASIRVYEGRVSTFEVRAIGRPGRQAPVKGTEIVRKANPYGRARGKLKALTVSSGIHTMREPVDLFEGTGIELDALMTKGIDQDVYQTDSDPDTVVNRINANYYDVYVIGRDIAVRIGAELAAKLESNVGKGAGLYIDAQKQEGRLEPMLKKVKEGTLGKGRVLRVTRAAPMVDFTPRQAYERIGLDDYPYDDWTLAEIASDVVRVARNVPAAGKAAKTDRSELVYGGERHIVEKAVDAAGATVFWRHRIEKLAGPTLGAFEDKGERVVQAVQGARGDGLSLLWKFKDFSGRVLARGEVKVDAGRKASFAVPREKLFTTIGVVAMTLACGPQTLDRRNEAVYVAENDVARNMQDYCSSVWPLGGEAYLRNVKEIYRQLEDIGIMAADLPITCISPYPCSLLTGFTCEGDFTGGGDIFCGRPQKSRVRTPSFNSKEGRDYIGKRARRMGEGYRRFGIRQAMICDEPNLQYPGTSDELDEHPENVAEYRVRMEAKYGTIAAYNRRHETAHKSFADVGPALLADARKAKRYAEFIEWRNFNVDRWCEAIRFVGDSVKAVCPGFMHTIGCSFGPTAFSGNDYWKLLTRAGIDFGDEYTEMVYFDRSPLRNFDELYRSFRPDMRTLCSTGFFYDDERAAIMPWWTAAHRFGGFNWFAVTSWGYNLLDEPSYAYTQDARALRDSLRRSRIRDGIGKLMIDWQWAPNDIAIYYSHDSMLLATALGQEDRSDQVLSSGPLSDYLTSRMCAYYLLENLLYQYDFVAPEQVTARNKLAGYKVLLMPRISAMSEGEVAAVKAFLAKGGRMVCDALPGDCDELGVKRAANPFEGLSGVTVWGRNFNDLDRADRARMLALLEEAKATKVLGSPDIVDTYGREAMHFVAGDADAYVVLRFPGRSTDAKEQEFVFGRRGHVYDMRVRKYLGLTDRVRALVPRCEASMFSVLPVKVEGVAIKAPASVRGGENLSVDVSLGQPLASVCHVELVPPSGDVRLHFKRNLTVKDGRTHLDFPIAFNDEKGTWRIRATEVLTGLVAERKVEVR